jgi:hypothetical protein
VRYFIYYEVHNQEIYGLESFEDKRSAEAWLDSQGAQYEKDFGADFQFQAFEGFPIKAVRREVVVHYELMR